MPKRSLGPHNNDPRNDAKKIEQLNQAVDSMLARKDGKAPKIAAAIEPLVRIAAELRNLPNASFKARLKSEFEGEKKMATLTAPTSAVPTSAIPTAAVPAAAGRPVAIPRVTFKDVNKAIEFYKQALGAK